MMYRVKRAIARTSLLALGVGFETVSKHDRDLKAEIADWQDGRVFSVGVLPDGPSVTLRKSGDRVRYLGQGDGPSRQRVLFKNVDAALPPLTGKMGSHTAFIQHRAILHGNVAEAMQMSRAMDIVQTYLMPGFVLKRTMKRAPKLTLRQYLLKAWVLSTLPFGLLACLRRTAE